MSTESEQDNGFAPLFEEDEYVRAAGWCVCMLQGDFGASCVCEEEECYCFTPGVQPGVKVCICERCIVKRHIKGKKESKANEEDNNLQL